MDKQFKYQWSSAKSNGEIVVVRSDDWTQFKVDVDLARIWMNKEIPIEPKEIGEYLESHKLDSKEFVDHTLKEDCELHNIKMKLRKAKDGREFYSHSKQLPDGSWDYCSGNGWRSEK